MNTSEAKISTPMYRLVARPSCRTSALGASKHFVGSFCVETGQYWWYGLSKEELARFCGSSKHLWCQGTIFINALELLDMMMSAYMLVVVGDKRPVGDRGCALLRGGNEAAVNWVRRCRGGKEPRSRTLMRLM